MGGRPRDCDLPVEDSEVTISFRHEISVQSSCTSLCSDGVEMAETDGGAASIILSTSCARSSRLLVSLEAANTIRTL